METFNTGSTSAKGVRIEGLEKVITAMKRSVDDSKKRRILLKALIYGAVPTRNAMKAGTPIKTGNLQSSIATITESDCTGSGFDGLPLTIAMNNIIIG